MKNKLFLLSALVIVLVGIVSQNTNIDRVMELITGKPTINKFEKYTGPTKISDVKVLYSDYWGAKIEYRYFQAFKINKDRININLGPNFTSQKEHTRTLLRTSIDGKVQSLFIPRLKGVTGAFKTTYINFEIAPVGDSRTRPFSYSFDRLIEWPSLEKIAFDYKTTNRTFDSIRSVSISENMRNSLKLRTWIMDQGISPNNIITSSGRSLKNVQLRLNDQITAHDLRLLVSKMSELNIEIRSFTRGEHNIKGNIEIGVDAPPVFTMDKEKTGRLVAEPLSNEEFYKLVGLVWLSKQQEAKLLAFDAKKLIDNHANLTTAKKLIDRALELDPEQAQAYIELARYFMRTKEDFTEHAPSATGQYVVDILSKAHEMSPNNADVLILLGYAQTTQNQFVEAEKAYRKAEEIGTDNWWLWNNWGLQKKKQGLVDEAISLFKVVTDKTNMSESNRFAFSDAAWDLANLYIQKGNISEANIVFEKHHTLFGQSLHACIYKEHAKMLVRYTNEYDRSISLANIAKKSRCNVNQTIAEARYLKWANNFGQDSQSMLIQAKSATTDLGLVYYNMSTYPKGIDTLLLLNKAGENLDIESETGGSALLYAIQYGNEDAVKALLQSGASPNHLSGKGQWPPLSIAIYRNRLNVIDTLLEYGADPKIKNSNGDSAIDLALEQGNFSLVKLLKRPSI